ncbi:MAG: glycosyl hydrolase 53 family protein [Chitinophagaceae bacterium]|nr:glycosyl hydrolase 53 family protein [Chitinophagaceae bacterium]
MRLALPRNFMMVTTHLLFVLLLLNCKKKSTAQPAPDNRKYYSWNQFAMGADLSYLNQVQDYGGVFKDSGIAKDPFTLFRHHGANTIRVRLWHNPQWLAALNAGKLYSDLSDVAKTIQRAKNAGMAVNLDFHYSDTWADPGHQQKPAAWNGLSFAVLKDSVYQYTTYVLNYLKARNLVPEMVQVGNETNPGMIFPDGQVVSNNYTPFADLLKSGIKAVRDFSATSTIKPQIILHVAQLQNATWWANGVMNVGGVTDFDILGVSHYHVWSNLTSMSEVSTHIRNLKNSFNKKIMIVETAYPWTSQNADNYNNIISGSTGWAGYGVSREEQLRYLKDLTQQVISGGGSGIMYWEPAWISTTLRDLWGTGSSWENNAFFDYSGNVLPAIDFMTYSYTF